MDARPSITGRGLLTKSVAKSSSSGTGTGSIFNRFPGEPAAFRSVFFLPSQQHKLTLRMEVNATAKERDTLASKLEDADVPKISRVQLGPNAGPSGCEPRGGKNGAVNRWHTVASTHHAQQDT